MKKNVGYPAAFCKKKQERNRWGAKWKKGGGYCNIRRSRLTLEEEGWVGTSYFSYDYLRCQKGREGKRKNYKKGGTSNCNEKRKRGVLVFHKRGHKRCGGCQPAGKARKNSQKGKEKGRNSHKEDI